MPQRKRRPHRACHGSSECLSSGPACLWYWMLCHQESWSLSWNCCHVPFWSSIACSCSDQHCPLLVWMKPALIWEEYSIVFVDVLQKPCYFCRAWASVSTICFGVWSVCAYFNHKGKRMLYLVSCASCSVTPPCFLVSGYAAKSEREIPVWRCSHPSLLGPNSCTLRWDGRDSQSKTWYGKNPALSF